MNTSKLLRVGTKAIRLHTVNFIVQLPDSCAVVTSLEVEKTQRKFEELQKSLQPFDFVAAEVVRTSVQGRVAEVVDVGIPINVLINMANVDQLKDGWQGRIVFNDGYGLESIHSFGGMLNVLRGYII